MLASFQTGIKKERSVFLLLRCDNLKSHCFSGLCKNYLFVICSNCIFYFYIIFIIYLYFSLLHYLLFDLASMASLLGYVNCLVFHFSFIGFSQLPTMFFFRITTFVVKLHSNGADTNIQVFKEMPFS